MIYHWCPGELTDDEQTRLPVSKTISPKVIFLRHTIANIIRLNVANAASENKNLLFRHCLTKSKKASLGYANHENFKVLPSTRPLKCIFRRTTQETALTHHQRARLIISMFDAILNCRLQSRLFHEQEAHLLPNFLRQTLLGVFVWGFVSFLGLFFVLTFEPGT